MQGQDSKRKTTEIKSSIKEINTAVRALRGLQARHKPAGQAGQMAAEKMLVQMASVGRVHALGGSHAHMLLYVSAAPSACHAVVYTLSTAARPIRGVTPYFCRLGSDHFRRETATGPARSCSIVHRDGRTAPSKDAVRGAAYIASHKMTEMGRPRLEKVDLHEDEWDFQ